MPILLLSLVLSIVLIYINRGSFKRSAIVSLIGLSVVAYLFNPNLAVERYNYYTDLVRFFNELDYIKNMDWSQALFSTAFPFSYNYQGLWLNNIFLLFCAKLNNPHILPLLSCIIFYGYLYVTLNKILNNCQYRKALCTVTLLCVYCLISYTSVTCNIRNPIAFLIGICTLYWDLVEQKSTVYCLIVYILMIFIHPFAILILVFRLISWVLNKYTSKIIEIGLMICLIALPILGNNIMKMKIANKFIMSIASKILAYGGAQKDLQEYGNDTLLILSIVLGVFYLCTLLILNFYCKENKYKKYIQIGFVIFFCYIGGYFFNIHMFYRIKDLIVFHCVLLVPLAYHFLKEEYKSMNYINRIKNIYYIYSMFLFLLAGANFYYYFGTINYQMINLGV